ncbi:hypothetical protein QPK13_22810 [Photorhabdus tasmaniensis]
MKFDLKSSPRHIQRLQNIASVISGICNINVTIDDNTKVPYFSKEHNLCVLPNGDYSDENFVQLIEGFTCHEAGHGRYTEHEIYENAFKSVLEESEGFIRLEENLNAVYQNLRQKQKAYSRAKRLTGLINLFDDVQMEEKVGRHYPEAKKRLAVTYALMVKAGRMTIDINSKPENPVLFIECYLLNSLRVKVLNQEGHKETLDPFFEYAEKILAPVFSEVEEIFHEALNCESTQNCDFLARKTLALLERLRDEAKEKQQQEEQNKQEQHDENDESSGAESETESTDQNDGKGEGDSDINDDESDVGDTESEGQSSDEGSENSVAAGDEVDNHSSPEDNPDDASDGESDVESEINADTAESDCSVSETSDKESNFSTEQWQQLAELLDDFLNSDEDSEDYHDALAKEIEVIASKVSDEVKAEFGASHWDIPDLLIDLNVYNEALTLSHSIGADLSVLQQVKIRGQNKTRDRGVSFDTNRLIQSPMGVRDVFRAQSESKNRGHVGLVVVRDISGSMLLESRYVHAIKSDLALTLAVEAVPKMHVANVIYPYIDKPFEVIKTFEQNTEETLSKFSLGCKGNDTPTGSALMAAVDLLLECQFDRKIILLITDGFPTQSDNPISEVMELAESNGIEIAGVSIKTEELIGFDEGTFVIVDDISLLSIEVSKLVHQILSN